jgi:hypothetical protein
VEALAQVPTHQAALEVGLEGQFVVPLLERLAWPGLVAAEHCSQLNLVVVSIRSGTRTRQMTGKREEFQTWTNKIGSPTLLI